MMTISPACSKVENNRKLSVMKNPDEGLINISCGYLHAFRNSAYSDLIMVTSIFLMLYTGYQAAKIPITMTIMKMIIKSSGII